MFILIAGFTSAYAYQRYGSKTLIECYNPYLLIRRFGRLLIPFFICWIIELYLLFSVNKLPSDIVTLVTNLLEGGYGWGAFFIPVILQSVLVIPLIYLLALRNPNRMVIIVPFLTLLFDAVSMALGLSGNLSSIIYFRYMFAGALGVWIVMSPQINKHWLIIGGISSLVYITIICYTSLLSSVPNFSGYDGILQAPAFMWTVILGLTGLKYFPNKIDLSLYHYVGEIGKSSWHIFLAQLIYYMLPAAYVYAFIVTPLSFGNEILQNSLIVILNLGICITFGYAWYAIEKRIHLMITKV